MESLRRSFIDLTQSLASWRLWTLLGWLQIRQRYARSKLGPFWLTISMGVLVATLGIVYGTLFGQKLGDYLPMIAIGIVVWGLFAGIVNEGCMAYVESANYIRQVRTPRLIYLLQVVWRNIVIFAHNFAIVVVVLLIFGVKNWMAIPMFVPGIILLVLNATWVGAVVGLLAARFRDLPQIVASFLQVAFYVTPILFSGRMLAGKHHWIVEFNPLAYLMEIVREPLLGRIPSPSVWMMAAGMAVLGWFTALWVTGRYHKRIPYWI